MSSLQNAPAQTPSQNSSTLSFAQGFILGQLSIVLLIGAFIKFFVFGEPSPTSTSLSPSQPGKRTRGISFSTTTSPLRPSSASTNVPPFRLRNKASSSLRQPPPLPSPATILAKTYYNTSSHQPESLDWFNVLVAQTIAQLRADALAEGNILSTLTELLNSERKPSWMGPVRINEVGLGEEFPIFSNCRVWPVEDEDSGSGLNSRGGGGGRLQARMDVDLSDALTLGIETTMVLNYPRPRIAVLPVALSVSVVRFSGTLSISFLPASPPNPNPAAPSALDMPAPATPVPPTYLPIPPTANGHPYPLSPSSKPPTLGVPDTQERKRTPTTLSFSFSPTYTLSLSTSSLLGSRSRLQDVPKIGQIIEAQLRRWFEERCVAPRTQRIVVPSLWPRMRNVVREEGKGGVRAPGSGGNAGGGREAEREGREEVRSDGGAGEGRGVERRLDRAEAEQGAGLRWRASGGGAGAVAPEYDMQMPGPMPGTLVA